MPMMSRNKFLTEAQEKLGVGPVEMARLLDTNFNTYKAWLYEENPMPGSAGVAVRCMLSNKPFLRSLEFSQSLRSATSSER